MSTTWFNEFLILKSEFFDWSKACFDRFRNWNFGIRKTMRWSAYLLLINWIWCSSKLFWKRKFEGNGRFVARCQYEQQVWTYSNIGQHEMLQIMHLQQLSTSVRLKAEVSVNGIYFVTKIVLAYCEKKLFYWSRKTFEIRGWRPKEEFIKTVKCQKNFMFYVLKPQ